MQDVVTTVTIVRPSAYSHCRADQISYDVRALLREAVETAVPFGSEAARESARRRVEQINDLLDHFLPI
jgi:hypothetical protein